MDEADRAASESQPHLDAAIARARIPAVSVYADGACRYCAAPVAPGLRWCNADCLADYEYRQRRIAAVGRK